MTCLSHRRFRAASSLVRRFASVLVFVVASSWASETYAATVAILSAAGPSDDVSEAIYRLRGELSSLKLEVLLLRRPDRGELGGGKAHAWLEQTAERLGIDAALEVIGETTPEAVDVWIFERAPLRSQVARVELELDTPNRAGALAIRAVEVLRSYILEADLAAKGHARRAGVEPSRSVDSDSTTGSSARAGLELGAGILTGLDGVGPAILPVLRSGWRAHPWLVVQATLSGLGTQPKLQATAGTVRVAQHYGALGLCYCRMSEKPLTPYVALAAGISRTSLYGVADSPARGHSLGHWSLLFDAGLGARLSLPGRFYSTLTGHVQVHLPHAAIHVVDQQIASTGRPNLLANLMVGAWL